MASTEELKKIINEFPRTKLSTENMDKLFSMMTEEYYKTEELIIQEGVINNNVYIMKDGIARGVNNMGGYKETTMYFALEADFVISMHSFVFNLPSFITLEACSDVTVMKLAKEDFDQFAKENIEFANWSLENSFGQLYALERRRKYTSGDAYQQYTSLVERRPDIVRNVPLKYIASYLGITQQSLSRLRNPKYKKGQFVTRLE